MYLLFSEYCVDVDAGEDADFADLLQLLAQFEVAAGTKIADHSVEKVEVGHRPGDAAELADERRIGVVEEFGAHGHRQCPADSLCRSCCNHSLPKST